MYKKLNKLDTSRSSVKRKSDNSNGSLQPAKNSHKQIKTSHEEMYFEDSEPRFTFEEVKEMIDRLISKQTRASPAVSAGLKRVNFEEIVVGEHSVNGCKSLIEQMVQVTRRVRTLQEVLMDIKDNLQKRTYTEIIHRATMKGDLPKKPPSAYLLYHQDRYNELRNENSLAVEVSKIVADEWKVLPEKKRREYHRRHKELVDKYEQDMIRLGLIDDAAPKRPKSAKTLYTEHCLSSYNTDDWSKETLAAEKERIAQAFDSLPANEKQHWIDQHQRNQNKYQKEREEYVASHPHLNHALPGKKTRANEKAKLPEPAKSAFKYFLMKKMPEGLDPKQADETKKKLKEKFSHLREKKLLKYIKKAVQDKERYDKQVEEYKSRYPGRTVPKTKQNITKEQAKLYAKVVENRPSLPAPTAYLHYCSRMLTDMNDNDDDQAPTARMQVASQSWKESNDKQKKAAVKQHMADIERYIREMDTWLASRTEEQRMQVVSEDQKANPDYWRKRLNKMRKAEVKKKEQKNAAVQSPVKKSPNSKGSPSKNFYTPQEHIRASNPMMHHQHHQQQPTYFYAYSNN